MSISHQLPNLFFIFLFFLLQLRFFKYLCYVFCQLLSIVMFNTRQCCLELLWKTRSESKYNNQSKLMIIVSKCKTAVQYNSNL